MYNYIDVKCNYNMKIIDLKATKPYCKLEGISVARFDAVYQNKAVVSR
jgi:hypothetical protein